MRTDVMGSLWPAGALAGHARPWRRFWSILQECMRPLEWVPRVVFKPNV
jgi:hypothetical protein